MAFDAHKNLAVASVLTPPSPAASGTSLVVTAAQGARFPATPFNATIWPMDLAPDPTTAEVVRVTGLAGDTLTITRAQEGTTARTVIAGDLIAATITAKSLTDIEAGTNFPLLTTAGTITLTGDLVFAGAAGILRATTADGADTGIIEFTGGGGLGPSRGATCNLFGNEWDGTRGGSIDLIAGQVASGTINFATGANLTRGRIHASGGLCWGTTPTVDPGTGAIGVANTGTGATFAMVFYNANGVVGYIQTSGSATVFGTSSDARLKQDRGRHIDLSALKATVVHTFTWISDGEPGRGVFAQEAVTVAPFAVTVGTDERDADGRLTHPWGVDYSKYVPDLIAGWQAHEATIAAQDARLAALEAQVAALLARLG